MIYFGTVDEPTRDIIRSIGRRGESDEQKRANNRIVVCCSRALGPLLMLDP